MIRFEVFREILIANELGGNMSLVYRFTDPDGERTGKSGYSFGVSQFDILNNPNAILCLRACEFTTLEITALKEYTAREKTPEHAFLEGKLKIASAVVDRWDRAQIVECLQVPLDLCEARAIKWADDAAFYSAADYHNQLYMSKGGRLHCFLSSLGRPFTARDVYDFKLTLPWGEKRPDDVRRRYESIKRIAHA